MSVASARVSALVMGNGGGTVINDGVGDCGVLCGGQRTERVTHRRCGLRSASAKVGFSAEAPVRGNIRLLCALAATGPLALILAKL